MVNLAFLADNVFGLRQQPIRVWGPQPVLDRVHEYLLNDLVWPDFTRIPNPENPVLQYCPLPDEGPVVIAGLQISWEQTNHPVHTVGYLFEDENSGFLYSGDTGDTESIWTLGRECANLAAAFIETSFYEPTRGLGAKKRTHDPRNARKAADKAGPGRCSGVHISYETAVSRRAARRAVASAPFAFDGSKWGRNFRDLT